MIVIETKSEAQTIRLGQDIALAIKPGDLIGLSGDLGVGKSVLARSIIRTLCDTPELEVPSPTYTLSNQYQGEIEIAHLDLYRIADPDELHELGLEDALDAGCALVEWPERGFDTFPADAALITINAGEGDQREITIQGDGALNARMDRSLRIRNFLDQNDFQGATRRAFAADASTRRYEVITAANHQSWYLMDAPRMPDGPPVRDGKPYSQIAHLAEDMLPFIAIGKLLEREGFAAPSIPVFDLDDGFAVIEDLGSDLIVDEDRKPISERYEAAIDFLVSLHGKNVSPSQRVTDGKIHQIPEYDLQAMSIETELLIDWYVPYQKGSPISDQEQSDFAGIWNALFDELNPEEGALVLRDFHSPNIIWRGDQNGIDRIGVIDFQDAVLGPRAYDVASLAQDARVDVSEELENHLLARYLDRAPESITDFDSERFETSYRIMAAQRATKILGIFVRLKERDGKDQYLRHLPRMQDYLMRSLKHPVMSRYHDWLETVIEL